MHVSADRLNSRHRKFINGHDLQTTRFFSGMGHSYEGRSRQQTASRFLWLQESILSAWVGVREAAALFKLKPFCQLVSRAAERVTCHERIRNSSEDLLLTG